MRIAYFGFDLFYDCLEYLSKNHQIVKIFTCKVDGKYETNDKTYNLAKINDIPITDQKVTSYMIDELEALDCDLMISAGYYFKIPVSQRIRAVNIHPSLLPEGRGPWPLPVIILKGIVKSGITCHEITDSFDVGDILKQLPVMVDKEENLDSLTIKMQEKAVDLIAQVVDDFEFLWKNKKPQNIGSYWPEPSVKEMTFTDKNTFDEINTITRAFFGFKCYYESNKIRLEIVKSKCVFDKEDVPIGAKKVLEISGGYLCILE